MRITVSATIARFATCQLAVMQHHENSFLPTAPLECTPDTCVTKINVWRTRPGLMRWSLFVSKCRSQALNEVPSPQLTATRTTEQRIMNELEYESQRAFGVRRGGAVPYPLVLKCCNLRTTFCVHFQSILPCAICSTA